MALEVAYVAVIMSGEVSDSIVTLRTGVYDRLRIMGEASKMTAVFLRKKRFVVCTVASRVELEGVIGASSDQELALVIEVEGCNIGVGFGEFKQLEVSGSSLSRQHITYFRRPQ